MVKDVKGVKVVIGVEWVKGVKVVKWVKWVMVERLIGFNGLRCCHKLKIC